MTSAVDSGIGFHAAFADSGLHSSRLLRLFGRFLTSQTTLLVDPQPPARMPALILLRIVINEYLLSRGAALPKAGLQTRYRDISRRLGTRTAEVHVEHPSFG